MTHQNIYTFLVIYYNWDMLQRQGHVNLRAAFDEISLMSSV